MLLLVVDTAGPTGGVLLARCNPGDEVGQDESQILGAYGLHPRAFSAELIPAIAELLQRNHLELDDVDGFAVVSGPGSFTGLRVGLSAVKALAEATAKPILTVSRLAILASVAARMELRESAGMPVHVVLDAGRGEFYHGIYRDEGETCVRESFETLESLTAGIHHPHGVVVASEPAVWNALAGMNGIDAREMPAATVQDVLPLACTVWRAGDFHDPASVDANYLRRSDAIVTAKLAGIEQPVHRQRREP